MSAIIESQGNQFILNVNGDRLVFHPTMNGVWVNGDGDNNVRIERAGNLLMFNSGISTLIAVPNGNGTWIMNADFDPPDPPDPEPGDFSWPYEPTWLHYVSSEFGPRSGRFHEGMDFAGGPASHNNFIPAIGNGTVTLSQYYGAFGNCIIIKLDTVGSGSRDFYMLAAHMVAVSSFGVGDDVDKDDNIGRVNNTGSSFGSHLHMEIHRTMPGAGLVWDNLNPSYSSPRTAMNPRQFFTAFGDGTWLRS